MGVLLHLVTDTGEDPPIAFNTQADPKEFCRKVIEYPYKDSEIRLLLDHFNLELEPLTRLSGEEFTLERWMSPYTKISGDWNDWTDERKLEAWNEHKAAIEASYQDPGDLIDAISPFVVGLEKNPAVYEIVGIEDSYFTEGSFLLHLTDLKRQAEWAQSQGFKKVRLLVA